jgi:hypothetical protein
MEREKMNWMGLSLQRILQYADEWELMLKLTMFWDSQGVLLAPFQKHGDNVNSASCCDFLLKFCGEIRKKY